MLEESEQLLETDRCWEMIVAVFVVYVGGYYASDC